MTSTTVTVFKVLAGSTSVMMLLSPSPAIYRIYKTHEIGHTSIIPIVSMLANSHVLVIYGYYANIFFPLFSTFVFGDIISLTYISIYYRWTPDRAYARKVLAVAATGLTIVSIYAILAGLGYTNQTRAQVASTTGYMSDFVSFMLYGSPLERVFDVLKHRSAVFIPIVMVVAASTNNAMWLTYSLLTRNWFIIVPNIVFLTIGISQICLYWIFHPSTHPLKPTNTVGEDATGKDDQVTITIPFSPKEDMYQESPSFTAMRSPLEPLNG